MATYQGMKVKLNNPTPIRKGEPGYGRKSKKVFVMSNGKVKKVMFGDPICQLEKTILKQEHHSELGTNVVLQKIKLLLVTGRVEIGKGVICQKDQKVIHKSK